MNVFKAFIAVPINNIQKNGFRSLSKNQQLFNFSKFYKKPSKPWNDSTQFKDERKLHTYYNFGLYAFVFGLCYAMVPFYKLFCEHVGLSGNFEQKDYSMKDKQLHIHKKYRVVFKAEADPEVDWEFEPVQDEVIVNAGETALVFYRAHNKEPDPVIGFATYNIFPEDASLYFSKIQCFCFNQQLLNPREELQLPIYFYLEPEIADDPLLLHTQEIRVLYRFIKCKKQDMLKFVEEEKKRIEENKKVLEQMRVIKQQKEKELQKQKEVENRISVVMENKSMRRQAEELIRMDDQKPALAK
ncbi:hypothetical protein ABPG74_010372 [Tetrahymena malaccensis]